MIKVTFEEAYPLIEKYARYFYRSGKFYSLQWQFEEGDMVQEVSLKFLTNGYLGMYKEETTSLAYFIMTGVKHFFIDCLRKQKDVVSLDKEDEEGMSLMDRIVAPGENLMDGVVYEELLEELPDETNSRIIITTPEGGQATLRNIARHLAMGYTQAELRKYMINPNNNKPISSGRLSQYVKEIREIYELCGVGV